MKTKILTLTIAAALPTTWACAQDDGPPRPPGPPREGERKSGPRDGDRPKGDGPREGQREGQRPPGMMPMPMPFLHTLDADDDGIISVDEIKGAPAALQKLDKNGDGKLTRDEWLPPMPPPPQGDGERKGGAPDGERKAGPRDGERPRGGPRDGESPRGGPRDGERPQGAARDGDRPRGGPRDGEGQAPERMRERPEGGARGQAERPPTLLLIEVLDVDRDGTISEEEIGQSSAALTKLDQNKDGQLGPREYGPRPPQGVSPREGGKDGQKLAP